MTNIFKTVRVAPFVCLLVWILVYKTECKTKQLNTTSTPTFSSKNTSTLGTLSGSCPRENVGTAKGLGVLSWPETIVGSRATIPCPNNRNSSATRECRYKDETFREILWQTMKAKACSYRHKRSQSIFDLSEKNVNSSNAIEVSEAIKRLSYPGEELIPEDVANTASILEKIAAVKGKANEVADNFFATIDNILDAPLDVVITGQRQTNSSLRIVQSLNNLLEILNITKLGSFRRTLKNFAVDLSIVTPGSFAGITFAGIVTEKPSSPLTNNNIVKEPTDNKTISQAKATTIHLPRSLFKELTFANFCHSHTVLLALYKETKFFRVVSSGPTNISQRLNSYVIAGSIKGQTVSNLKKPIVLTYPSLKLGDKNSTLCGFWNFSRARWSHEGCVFQGLLEDGRVVCHCDHLTNFAMLMDIQITNDETSHEKILGLISYIGCALSLVGLMLTIITILMFKDLRNKTPNQILLNFCVALSLTLIVFLAAAERSKTSSMATCRAAAVALHYFVLVVFMWMAIEAFNMYLAFVKVLPTYIPKFILKCCVVAWGIPAVIVSITVGVALGYYGDKKYCRLHGLPFYVSFLTPVLLILVANSIAFVLIFRSLLLSGSKITAVRKRSGFQPARQGAAIVVVLGLTWLFGVLAINDAKLVFQYLFCIINSLQGLLIFVFFFVLPSGARDKYKTFLPKFSKKGKNTKREVYTTTDSARKNSNSGGNDKAKNCEGAVVLNTLSGSSNVCSFTNNLGQLIEFGSYEKKTVMVERVPSLH